MAHSGKTMTFATDLVPQENNIYSLGNADLKWIIRGSLPLSDVTGADDLKAIEAISGTTGLLKKTAANTWTLDTNNYVTSSGITSITIGATSPVQSSTSTTQSGSSASTTISLKDAYGDTKNPYGSKTKNYVLAAPNGSNGAPSFRALVAADIPDLGGTYVKKISSTLNAIAKFSGTDGAITNSEVTIDDNSNIFTTGLLQTGRYFHNVATYNCTNTPKEILIKTKIPFANSAHMPKIIIHMYNYSDGLPTEIGIVFYIYNGAFCNMGVTSNTKHRPKVTLCTYTESDTKYVGIGLGLADVSADNLPHSYYIHFNVDYLDIWPSVTRTSLAKGWTITGNTSTTSIIPTDDRKNLSYVDQAQTAKQAAFTSVQYGIAYYSDTAGTFAGTGAGTSGQYLKSNGSSAPTWATFSSSTVGLGNVENTKLSTWAGSSNITTVGTISSGTWHGTKIANDYIANPKVTIAGNDVSLGGSLAAATLRSSLELTTALRFIGKATTDMSESTTTAPTVSGVSNYIPIVGDVVLDKNSEYEYVCIGKSDTTYTWEKLGSSSSYALSNHVHGNITNDGKVGTTANRALITGTSGAVTAASSIYMTSNNLGVNATGITSPKLLSGADDTQTTMSTVFYVAGNSYLNGTTVMKVNNRAIEFRPDHASYNSYIYYGTAGNEALSFVNRQAVTSFIFWTGNRVESASNWYLQDDGATARTDNPAVQIKQNSLYINKLLPSGTDASYKLYVNGAGYINGSLTIPLTSAYYGILGQVDSNAANHTGGLTWHNHHGISGTTINAFDTPSTSDTWWYVLRNRHTNTGNNYYTDLAIPMNANTIYYKRIQGNTDSETIVNSSTNNGWVAVLDQLNYNTYTVTKTGGGASGSWGISITGSSASCTGNAATANAIKTAGTTAQFYRGDNSWSDTISGGTLKITNNSNTVTIGSQNNSFTHIYNSADVPFIFNKSILTTSGDLGGTTYPFNNLYIGPKGSRSIYYVGTKATNAMITFLDNTADAYGNGIKIGGGGTVVVGSGESATNLSVTAGNENLYLTSDEAINIEAGGSTIANRIGMQITTAGHIIPVKAESNNTNAQDLGSSSSYWRSIYAQGSIYITKAGETGIEVDNTQSTNPNKVAFIVGSSGNGGIYSRKHSKWIVYADASGNVVLNGNANTATKLSANASNTTASFWRGDNTWASNLTDQLTIYNSTTTRGDAYSGGIQLREFNVQTTGCELNWYNAPGITFHWGGRWVNKLGIYTGGDLFWGSNKLLHAGNTATGTDNNKTLAWGTTYTIAKINGTDIKFTMPGNPNTDTNTATATDNILDGSNSGTAITYAPYSAQQNKLSFDTSTTAAPTRTDRLNLNGFLYATKYNVAGEVTLQYNTADQSLEFIF